jgi:succinate dehydrogenase / fumarate reductase, membrane anchor subunit
MSSVVPDRPRVREARPAAVERRAGRSRAVAYLVVRVTGALLAVLVLGHFALTHVVEDVADTGSAFIGRRWASAFWLLWDWAMLGAAFAHAGAGVWVVIDDYTPDPTRRRDRRRLLVAGCAALWAIGSVLVAAAALR